MVIEFCGLPGSGKSTMMSEIRLLYNHKGIDSIDFMETKLTSRWRLARVITRIARTLIFCVLNVALVVRVSQIVMASKGGRMYAIRRSWVMLQLLDMTDRLSLVADRSEKVVLLDQGAIQALWSIVAINYDRAHVYAHHIIKYVVHRWHLKLILIAVSPELASNRCNARAMKGHFFDDMLDRDRRDIFMRSVSFFNNLLPIEWPSDRLVVIDSESELHTAVEAVWMALSNYEEDDG